MSSNWSNYTSHQKNTRIKFVIFFVGLSSIAIYGMGINDFISLIGTLACIYLFLYGINEIISWFKK